MPSKLIPYVKQNRRSDTYSVYAPIDGKMKVIGIYRTYKRAYQVKLDAENGIINTTRFPNYSKPSSDCTN